MNLTIKKLLMKALVKLSRKPQAKVALEKLDGLVLDIGAGGEGTMARTCESDIVCLDISAREITEALSQGAVANWVLADACSMPFRNGIFDAATLFFSLMYVKTIERKQAVLTEGKRILGLEGLLYVWDATIREEPDLFIIFVEAHLPNGARIYTGYGVKGQAKAQSFELISKAALEAGFKVKESESHKNWYTAVFHRIGITDGATRWQR